MKTGLLMLAAAAGLLSGMAAGGGTVLVPGLVLLFAIPQHKAQGAVLAAFLFTQSAAALGQWRRGNLSWALARRIVPGSLIGALAGAWLAGHTAPATLRRIYGGYLLLVGAAALLTSRPQEKLR